MEIFDKIITNDLNENFADEVVNQKSKINNLQGQIYALQEELADIKNMAQNFICEDHGCNCFKNNL